MKFATFFFFFFQLLFSINGHCQSALKEVLSASKNFITQTEVESIYATAQYKTIWMDRTGSMEQLFQLLASAHDFALNEKDYHFLFIQQLKRNGIYNTDIDSLKTDIILTDAALHFFKELKTGNIQPSFGYDGLKYIPQSPGLTNSLLSAIETGRLLQLASDIQPPTPEYKKLLNKYRHLSEPVRSNQRELTIVSKTVSASNRPLMVKLFRLGLIDSVDGAYQDKEMLQHVRIAQRMFNLIGDGILKPITLGELNVPVDIRIKALAVAINYSRWLQGLKDQYVAVVNIPSASLYVYRNQLMILDSRLIVGKTSTPTPSLTSTIHEVILYPYWNVPYKIATRELLPSIKRNRNYLAANNFQVLDRNGKVLDPYSINWHSLSAGYFPYTIRQSTGCDNSLGLIKFNFYNPFTVYLHDTPAKGLFTMNKRFFSHGCMRVEKPVEFGQILLGRNRIAMDTLTIKGCLKSQAPRPVPTEEKLPVVVMYSTAWYDSSGTVIFFEDIYHRNKF